MADRDKLETSDKVFFGIMLLVASIVIVAGFGGHPLAIVSVVVGGVVGSILLNYLTKEAGWKALGAMITSYLVFLLTSALAAVVIVVGLIALVIWILSQLGGGSGGSSGYRKTGEGTFQGKYERWEKR